jgi:hypothetical protein
VFQDEPGAIQALERVTSEATLGSGETMGLWARPVPKVVMG